MDARSRIRKTILKKKKLAYGNKKKLQENTQQTILAKKTKPRNSKSNLGKRIKKEIKQN